MAKLKFTIDNDNFDAYFNSIVGKLTEDEISDLPDYLQFKLFRSNNSLNDKNTSKLTFLQKLYTLHKAAKKRWYIVVEDEEEGLDVEDFIKFKDSTKKRELTISNAEELVLSGDCVLGSKELIESLAFRNYLFVSAPYAYAIKAKNLKTDFAEFKKCALYFTKLIANYESNKKKIVMQKGLKMPELYILLYFYDGEKKKGSDVYNTKFKLAYNSSKSQINTGLTKLHNIGLLTKHGSVRHTEYSITALGIETVNQVLRKFVLDF